MASFPGPFTGNGFHGTRKFAGRITLQGIRRSNPLPVRKAGTVPGIRKMFVLVLFLGLGAAMAPLPAAPCSCDWRGPFLSVAVDAPLVVVGRILRHHSGQAPAMDVLVQEILAGGLLDGGLTVQMGDGMHCRPVLDGFPPGSEWILALNGPGSKPGNGFALSHCGEYWLRVDHDDVEGSIDGTLGQVKRMPLREFRLRFLYPPFREVFSGKIVSGERFRRPFGHRFVFFLEPSESGWEIVLREYGREENLARLTPPLHSAPNPRDIRGWQLADDPKTCAPCPYATEAAPGNPRKFVFSPDVGRGIDGEKTGGPPGPEEIEAVRRFGRGTLKIEGFGLRPGKDGCPDIEWLKFSVRMEGGYGAP